MAADLDKVVAKFVEIRDAKAEVEKRHKSELVPYVEALEKLEAYLRGVLAENNAESMKTGAGTFFKKLKTSVTVANRETYLQWARDTGQWDLLDVRAAKTNVLAYKAAHGDIPPGIDYRAEVEVQVRRS